MSGLAFGIVMITITVLVDMKIGKDFVKPSISLALTNARIIDEENAVSLIIYFFTAQYNNKMTLFN